MTSPGCLTTQELPPGEPPTQPAWNPLFVSRDTVPLIAFHFPDCSVDSKRNTSIGDGGRSSWSLAKARREACR